MFSLEQSLHINKSTLNMSIYDVLDQYYKQMHMLVSNLYLAYKDIDKNNEMEFIFPNPYHLYDAAWYKNIIVTSYLIYDRLHMLNDQKIDYALIFNNESSSNFIALAKLWNKINYIVKTNVDKSLWLTYKTKWNLVSTTYKLEQLINFNISYNHIFVNHLDYDLNKYQNDSIGCYQQICNDLKPLTYQELLNYELQIIDNQLLYISYEQDEIKKETKVAKANYVDPILATRKLNKWIKLKEKIVKDYKKQNKALYKQLLTTEYLAINNALISMEGELDILNQEENNASKNIQNF